MHSLCPSCTLCAHLPGRLCLESTAHPQSAARPRSPGCRPPHAASPAPGTAQQAGRQAHTQPLVFRGDRREGGTGSCDLQAGRQAGSSRQAAAGSRHSPAVAVAHLGPAGWVCWVHKAGGVHLHPVQVQQGGASLTRKLQPLALRPGPVGGGQPGSLQAESGAGRGRQVHRQPNSALCNSG